MYVLPVATSAIVTVRCALALSAAVTDSTMLRISLGREKTGDLIHVFEDAGR